MEKGESKKYKKERRRRKFSNSKNSSFGTNIDASTTEMNNSDSEAETSSNRQATRSKNKKVSWRTIKVKVEDDDWTQESLEAVKFNLMNNQMPRQIVPTTQANV